MTSPTPKAACARPIGSTLESWLREEGLWDGLAQNALSHADGQAIMGRNNELLVEIARLRAGIQAMLDGDYPHPRAYRPCQCPHGIEYYDDCGQCDAAWLTALLADPGTMTPAAPAEPLAVPGSGELGHVGDDADPGAAHEPACCVEEREPARSRVAADLLRAITTAANDDTTEPGTEARERHIERLAAMSAAYRALVPDGAEVAL